MEALRRTSNLFDLFAQYAGVGPAAEHLWAFFDRMPVRGSSYSRCQAWRVYIALKAAAAGDAKSALEALSWSDDLVLLMLAEQRKQGQGG